MIAASRVERQQLNLCKEMEKIALSIRRRIVNDFIAKSLNARSTQSKVQGSNRQLHS